MYFLNDICSAHLFYDEIPPVSIITPATNVSTHVSFFSSLKKILVRLIVPPNNMLFVSTVVSTMEGL